ncbi:MULTISPECIES: hypothetical protein [Bifidobacterium]|uniref:hypothetical protein n=1 Tax=Bifidobacterium TaxID=1678 RepID=UPI001BDC4B8D|nr:MULTISPECIES: hypothetical protein [Bifidobacterium]MBT1162693.1 hypothetical protein [Bifidobacterium sp. SO1]MBW3079720.1 hypothetical protein [Bifidobacterium simiiventris]
MNRNHQSTIPTQSARQTQQSEPRQSSRSEQSDRPGQSQLSAADALSFLAADREATADRYTLPFSFDLIMCVFLGLMLAAFWLLTRDILTPGSPVFAVACVGFIAALVASVAALMSIWRKRGIHAVIWPPTRLAAVYMVLEFILGIVVTGVLVIAPLPHWQAALVIVATALAALLLERLTYRDIRRYIIAGGSMSPYVLGHNHRRYGANGELWTMARFRALPDDERREAAQLVVMPLWFYPFVAAGAVAVIWAVGDVAAMVSAGAFSWHRAIDATFLASCAGVMFERVVQYVRDNNMDTRMRPPTRVCWALMIAMWVTCLVPVYLSGFAIGYAARHAEPPVGELFIGGAVFVVLFSALGWMYDRKQRDAIAAGA